MHNQPSSTSAPGSGGQGEEQTSSEDRLLTAKEVAALLAVPESWVREATRDGRLPHLKLGRYRRYQRAVIDAWLQTQKSGPTC
jgi:excisionase family DNA binding protein